MSVTTDAEQPGVGIGRREAHKRATRKALQDAADRLFAERGAPQTTVRDIAEAAGVTERTFFRYFRSKEDLIIREAFDWMPLLQRVISERPAEETPLTAVRRALERLIGSISRTDAASPLALFAAGAPGERVGPSAFGIMRKVEADLADALEQRLGGVGAAGAGGSGAVDTRFAAEVYARAAAAAFRSAMLRDAELNQRGEQGRPALIDLLGQAFDVLEPAR